MLLSLFFFLITWSEAQLQGKNSGKIVNYFPLITNSWIRISLPWAPVTHYRSFLSLSSQIKMYKYLKQPWLKAKRCQKTRMRNHNRLNLSYPWGFFFLQKSLAAITILSCYVQPDKTFISSSSSHFYMVQVVKCLYIKGNFRGVQIWK